MIKKILFSFLLITSAYVVSADTEGTQDIARKTPLKLHVATLLASWNKPDGFVISLVPFSDEAPSFEDCPTPSLDGSAMDCPTPSSLCSSPKEFFGRSNPIESPRRITKVQVFVDCIPCPRVPDLR